MDNAHGTDVPQDNGGVPPKANGGLPAEDGGSFLPKDDSSNPLEANSAMPKLHSSSPPVASVNPRATDSPAWRSFACLDLHRHAPAHHITMESSHQAILAASAVIAKSSQLWPNDTTINYGFLGSLKSHKDIVQQGKVKRAIEKWEVYANVKFNCVDSQVATIRITFDPTLGSWSYVGMEAQSISSDQATMNLGWVTGDEFFSDSEEGVILHEFGHTLGLMHEHQSPARGGTLTLKENTVIDFYMTTQDWSEEEIREQILNVYNTKDISNYSRFDAKSIMMCFMPAEMNEQGKEVKPNDRLSDLDKAYMMINYPFTCGRSPDITWTIEHALDVADVDSTTRALILQEYSAGQWENIRNHFSAWSIVAQGGVSGPEHGSSMEEDALFDWCASEHETFLRPGASHAVASIHSELWTPGEVITYAFQQGPANVTDYRKRRVRETFTYYEDCANLKFTEIPYDPNGVLSDICIHFGPIPIGLDAYSLIGKEARGYRASVGTISLAGGDQFSTMIFTDRHVPELIPTNQTTKIYEERVLYHEIGHALGLRHEHSSPFSMTISDPNTPPEPHSAVTPFDYRSIMLYAGKKLRASTLWESIKDWFKARSKPLQTEFNREPSEVDRAFLGVIYPWEGDVRFTGHLKTLRIDKATESLTEQRDLAFQHKACANRFDKEIAELRNRIERELASVKGVPYHSARPSMALNPPKPDKPVTTSFIDAIMGQLESLFAPTGGQIFALQFPGRFLAPEQYAWDTSAAGIYGQFVKPLVVNESDFRLVDQLYDVGPVISAPNGMNLSMVYEQCLHNLLPSFQVSSFSKQNDKIRQWLMKEVPTSGCVQDVINAQRKPSASSTFNSSIQANIKPSTVRPLAAISNDPPKPKTVNRMERAQALMQEYMTAKSAWDLERDKMIRNSKGEELENVTHRLAPITSIREAEMDVKSPAEFLQDAKDALREASVSSVNGSMKIYPVQMQPIDWFQGLSTSFTLEDLTSDPELIEQQVNQKSRQLDVLNSRLAAIQLNPKTDMAALEGQLNAAQTVYDTAQASLTKSYTNNVIALAKTCVDSSGTFAAAEFSVVAKSNNIEEKLWKDIDKGMAEVASAQLSVTQASRSYSRLLSAKALAQSTDTEREMTQINTEILAITRDLTELTSRAQALRSSRMGNTNVTASSTSIEDVKIFPGISGSSGGSRWQEIHMYHTIESKHSEDSSKSQGKASKDDVSLFFGSYHAEASSGDATAGSIAGSTKYNVEIGFRATLVTVDRGGWFQPQFFKESNAYHHIDERVSWSKWPKDITKVENLKDHGPGVYDTLNANLLPAFPVGYIICKDITIKIEMSSAEVASSSANMERTLASSGGVLCWSTSSSEHQTSSDKSYAFTALSDGCIIRIPGPQILGYILQLTDDDKTTALPTELPEGFLVGDAQYNATATAST